jgi:hypothetical protein
VHRPGREVEKERLVWSRLLLADDEPDCLRRQIFGQVVAVLRDAGGSM